MIPLIPDNGALFAFLFQICTAAIRVSHTFEISDKIDLISTITIRRLLSNLRATPNSVCKFEKNYLKKINRCY